MIKIKSILALVVLLTVVPLSNIYSQQNGDYPLNPPRYICYRAESPVEIDGDIYTEEWNNALWSDEFVDIRGKEFESQPIYPTRMKMLWDDTHLYVAAELIEPDIWATITERDATIFFDNDFELFIDPSGSTHSYYEFEINAFGTEWDLLMTKPYKFGGTFINGYTMNGLKTKVKHYGTINNPNDRDEKWVVEMAIPLKALVNGGVKAGATWRINFSRVEWLKFNTQGGKYNKNSGTEGFGNEENWVWAPTGIVDIHKPEYWGFVQFNNKTQGSGLDEFVYDQNEETKFALRRLLNQQIAYNKDNGRYATSLEELTGSRSIEDAKYKPTFHIAPGYIVISATSSDGSIWNIGSDSRVWRVK